MCLTSLILWQRYSFSPEPAIYYEQFICNDSTNEHTSCLGLRKYIMIWINGKR